MIVGKKDEPGWVKAITQLLQDEQLRQNLGKAGLEKAHRLYSWPAVAKQHLDFFEINFTKFTSYQLKYEHSQEFTSTSV